MLRRRHRVGALAPAESGDRDQRHLVADPLRRALLEEPLQIAVVVLHEHGHHVDLLAPARRRLAQHLHRLPRPLGRAGELALGVVLRRVGVVDGYVGVDEAGGEERPGLLRGDEPAVGEERRQVLRREGLDDLHEIGARQGLAAFDGEEEAAEAGHLGGDAAVFGGGQLFLAGGGVGPEVAEAALHVAAVGDLDEAGEGLLEEEAGGEAGLFHQGVEAHPKGHPLRCWRPRRRATSRRSGARSR